MLMIVECPGCGNRVEWNTDHKDQRCTRCRVMGGNDIPAIISELRKGTVPGQEPILKMIEILDQTIKNMEVSIGANKNIGGAGIKVASEISVLKGKS